MALLGHAGRLLLYDRLEGIRVRGRGEGGRGVGVCIRSRRLLRKNAYSIAEKLHDFTV